MRLQTDLNASYSRKTAPFTEGIGVGRSTSRAADLTRLDAV